jgi:hypothetical protein
MQFKHGPQRGRLAAAMDLLSDLAVILGTHVAYCRSGRSSGQPARDMQDAMQHVQFVKELVASVMASQQTEE